MNVPLEDSFIQTNGIRLHVIRAGPLDGPLVILLHGFPEFWYGWKRQIEGLAEAGFRVVALDQRGYNLSDTPQEVKAYRLEELSKDIVGLMDALGAKDCALAGHDWGAAVAWFVAMAFPERVRKLAILNVPHPQVMLEFLRKHPRQLLKSWYIGYFQITGLADWTLRSNNFQQAANALLKSSRPGTFSETDIDQYKKAWKNSGGMTGMLNWYRALVRYRPKMPEDIRLHMPVRILWGKRDAFLRHEMAAESAKFCNSADVTLFENATHWVQHEEPEAVNEALVKFFM